MFKPLNPSSIKVLPTKLGLQPWCPVPFRNRAGKGLRHQMNLLQPVCQRNLASWSQNEDFLRVCCKKSWYVWHHFDIWYLLVSDILSMKSDEPFWESCSGACLEFTRLWYQNEACWCWTVRRFPKAFWHVNDVTKITSQCLQHWSILQSGCLKQSGFVHAPWP